MPWHLNRHSRFPAQRYLHPLPTGDSIRFDGINRSLALFVPLPIPENPASRPPHPRHNTTGARAIMAVKVGINGFGRIGRNVFRSAIGNPDIEFVAVNDLTTPATLAHLLKYDSILGNLKNEITHGADFIAVDGKKIKVFAERDPAKLDWASVGAQ